MSILETSKAHKHIDNNLQPHTFHTILIQFFFLPEDVYAFFLAPSGYVVNEFLQNDMAGWDDRAVQTVTSHRFSEAEQGNQN